MTDKEHPIKRLGYCSICNELVFETTAAGAIGRPRPDAVRAKIAMVDGSFANLTLCTGCADDPDLGRLFEVILGAWWLELDDDYRVSCGGARLEPKQREALRWSFGRQLVNPPLGVVHREPWTRALEREAMVR